MRISLTTSQSDLNRAHAAGRYRLPISSSWDRITEAGSEESKQAFLAEYCLPKSAGWPQIIRAQHERFPADADGRCKER